jgi:hypothetical protein
MFPIASRLYSSSAVVFGKEVYGDDAGWFIDISHTLFKSIADALWWFKYRFIKKHKHHIIYTKMKPGYSDERERILWGLMACLERHIFDTHGGQCELGDWTRELRESATTDENGMENCLIRQAHIGEEALAIWHWWTVERPANQKREEELLHLAYGREDIMRREEMEDGMIRVHIEHTPEEEVYCKEMYDLEEKMETDEQGMLYRLIDIRQGLWD